MPYLYYFAAWFFLIFCQVDVAPRIGIGEIYPDIVMAAIVLIGLKKGWKKGLWFGFALGITMDILNPQNYGWTTLMLSFSGYFAGYIREKIFLDNIFYQSLAASVFALVYPILFQLINWPFYLFNNFVQSFLESILVAIYTFIISLIALFILSQRSRLKELL
jgi:rod shape-determining protein MreD